MDPRLSIFLGASAFLAVTGLLLLRLGWRGKRINDHPICRRCGFDLFGHPPDSPLCSECGADLRAKSAVRIGARRRRHACVAVGTLFFILGIVPCATVAWRTGAHFSSADKPTWWLLANTRSADKVTRATAIDELVRRAGIAALSKGQLDTLRNRILEAQADPKQTWKDQWGGLIETTRNSGALDDARWDRYWRQAWRFSIEPRPRVRQGDPVPIILKGNSGRTSDSMCTVMPRLVATRVNGVDCPPPRIYLAWEEHTSWRHISRLSDSGVVIPPYLGQGTNRIDAEVEVTVSRHRRGAAHDESIRTRVATSATFDVISPDLPAAIVTTAPEYAEKVRRSVFVQPIHLHRSSDHSGRQALVHVSTYKPPVAIAAKVYLRFLDREWELGKLVCDRDSSGSLEKFIDVEGYFDDRVNVVLKPDPASASEVVHASEVWGATIAVEDVAIAP